MRLPDQIKGPYWEPRDIWFGVYWDTSIVNRYHEIVRHWKKDLRITVYICIVPCFPVRLIWDDQPSQQRTDAPAAASGGGE